MSVALFDENQLTQRFITQQVHKSLIKAVRKEVCDVQMISEMRQQHKSLLSNTTPYAGSTTHDTLCSFLSLLQNPCVILFNKASSGKTAKVYLDIFLTVEFFSGSDAVCLIC